MAREIAISRFGDIRSARPKLYAWHDAFAARPSMRATAPAV